MQTNVEENKRTTKVLIETMQNEFKKGNVVLLTMEGGAVTTPIKNLIDQPVDGLLYDLNRLEEVALTLLPHNVKAVNDFATAKVIRELYKQNEELKQALEDQQL